MQKPSVSIVVLAYNEAEQIRSCLDAIARQTDQPEEVILVDNNSTDDTVSIAKEYKFVTIIKEATQGIVFARNAGFNAAKSDLIARIDSDTNLLPDWVKTVRELARNLPRDDAVTGPCKFRGVKVERVAFVAHRVVYFWSSRLLLGHTTLFGSNMFLWRTNWQKLRRETCLRTDIHEDMDLAFHLVKKGGKVHFSSSLSASVSSRRWLSGWAYPAMWYRARSAHRPKSVN